MGIFTIYDHTCAECYNCDINDKYCGKVRCNHYCKWVDANARANDCYSFSEISSRSSYDIKKAEDYSKNYSSGTCFITTALCKILSMSDDNRYLNTLREFRNNYLQKDDNGLKILIEYDEIGPKISKSLYDDNGKFNLAYILFNNYIIPTVNLIENKKYSEAIYIYMEMTKKLAKFYNIDDKITVKVDEIEPKLSGHGRLVFKKKCCN